MCIVELLIRDAATDEEVQYDTNTPAAAAATTTTTT
jgi:hypothetical protein